MKAFYPTNYYVTHYNGEKIIIKATPDEIEYLYRNDPNITSDYSLLKVYKLEKAEKPNKETA